MIVVVIRYGSYAHKSETTIKANCLFILASYHKPNSLGAGAPCFLDCCPEECGRYASSTDLRKDRHPSNLCTATIEGFAFNP